MSTPAKATTKAQKPIKPASGDFRYAGAAWQKDGIAVATTDGRWLAARAKSLEEAATLIESAEDDLKLPPRRGAASLLRSADRNDVRGTMTIDATTKPEETHAQRARDRREAKVQSAEAELVQAEAHLAETMAKPKHLRVNTRAQTELEGRRKDVVRAREALRNARNYYEPGESTISCEGVLFDLNLVRTVLRSLGESRATLDVSGTYDPGVLRTTTGIGILMPLKPEAM